MQADGETFLPALANASLRLMEAHTSGYRSNFTFRYSFFMNNPLPHE
jgi:hypothetical protein